MRERTYRDAVLEAAITTGSPQAAVLALELVAYVLAAVLGAR